MASPTENARRGGEDQHTHPTANLFAFQDACRHLDIIQPPVRTRADDDLLHGLPSDCFHRLNIIHRVREAICGPRLAASISLVRSSDSIRFRTENGQFVRDPATSCSEIPQCSAGVGTNFEVAPASTDISQMVSRPEVSILWMASPWKSITLKLGAFGGELSDQVQDQVFRQYIRRKFTVHNHLDRPCETTGPGVSSPTWSH